VSKGAELDIEAEDSGRDGWFMAMTAQGVEKGTENLLKTT